MRKKCGPNRGCALDKGRGWYKAQAFGGDLSQCVVVEIGLDLEFCDDAQRQILLRCFPPVFIVNETLRKNWYTGGRICAGREARICAKDAQP